MQDRSGVSVGVKIACVTVKLEVAGGEGCESVCSGLTVRSRRR